MSKLLYDEVVRVGGVKYTVSTIRTPSGGAAPAPKRFGDPFGEADYIDDTPWPFETVVFAGGSSKGLYHQAYATEAEARDGHAKMVKRLLFEPEVAWRGGVTGIFGTPCLTAKEWAERAG